MLSILPILPLSISHADQVHSYLFYLPYLSILSQLSYLSYLYPSVMLIKFITTEANFERFLLDESVPQSKTCTDINNAKHAFSEVVQCKTFTVSNPHDQSNREIVYTFRGL